MARLVIHPGALPRFRLAAFVIPMLVVGLIAEAGAMEPIEFRLGLRTVRTEKCTAGGVSVVPMWAAPSPSRGRAAGFPLAAGVEHFLVWSPSDRSEGAFNHFAALASHRDLLFAMWGNHWLGEFGPGQRALYTTSADGGRTWSKPIAVFPQPGKIAASGEPGIYLSPDRWVTLGEKLYAVAYVVSNGAAYPIARRVGLGGDLGPPFLVRPLPANAELPVFMAGLPDRLTVTARGEDVWRWYADNGVASWWGEGLPKYAVDKARLIEPVRYRARDGTPVLLLRSFPIAKEDPPNNYRLYVSFGDGIGGWSLPHPTDIPDSPSRSEALVLANGTTLPVGNQVAPQFDAWKRYLPRDPLTVALSKDGYLFDRAFAVRTNAPTDYRFSGILRRSLGYGYPSSVVHHDQLCILYSIGKEDMALSRVPLRALGL